MSRFFRLALWPLALLLTLLPSLVFADPPARVGRLAHVENSVNFRVDRSTERGPASVNWPISSGAILDTDWRGRAEVWIGSTAYRVAGNSEVEFAQVDDQQITVNVSVGSLAVSIMDRDQANDLTVMTPEGSVRFATPGRYRVDVYSDHSEVTAQAGQAVFDERGRPIAVNAGQKARLYQGERPRIDGDFDQDAFDFWVAERENASMSNATRRYVSPQMTGYQDLDANGDWRPEAEYGSVWYPRSVADDWAPYRFGRWAWVAPWGWTWIDQAPWGFAPFHYGRWVQIHNRWAWAPGRHESRPVYAPALVGWIGNPGWSASFSFGSAPAVGWFPLAPREVYVPAYRHSPTYTRQININHVQNITVIERAERPGANEHFMHRDRPQAVTVMPANQMREGKPISRSEFRRPEQRDLERAPQASRVPSATWLAPAAGANRPRPEEHRDNVSGASRGDGGIPARPMSNERPTPRQPAAMNAPTLPEARPAQPAGNNERRIDNRRAEPPQADTHAEPRRDNNRSERDRRQPEAFMPPPAGANQPAPRQIESTPPSNPVRQESPLPRREIPVAPPAGPATGSPSAPQRQELPSPRREMSPGAVPPSNVQTTPPPTRELRQEIREPQRIERATPRDNDPNLMRPREIAPPAPASRPPAPQPMREERQAPPTMPSPEREPRREMREMQREMPQIQRDVPREAPRQERNMPREAEAPAFRQREMPAPQPAPAQAPAPVMRAPQVQAAPPPVQAARPSAPPAPPQAQAAPRGGDRENGRRPERGDDKGEHGPR